MRAWVVYSIIRVGLFLAVFGLLYALNVVWWVAAISAAVIALCVSYIFLGKLRGRVTAELAERRDGAKKPAPVGSDEDVEDALNRDE